MVVITEQKNRPEAYFLAWKNFDTILLGNIFSTSAKYIIRGKRIYTGIEEIKKYWERNKNRQRNLKLHWHIVKTSSRCDVVNFSAYFFDIEENVYTKINGQIIFIYDANDKIIKLTEAYKKRTKIINGKEN